jgi:hypothetical protein
MRAIYLFVVFMHFFHPGLYAQEAYEVRFGLGYPFTNNQIANSENRKLKLYVIDLEKQIIIFTSNKFNSKS